MLKPLKDRIVAKKPAATTTTASGILLGEAKEKPTFATVESIGKEVKEIKPGDKILYREYSATEIKVENTDYLILKEEDVLATL
jgi:chaperonin GroES